MKTPAIVLCILFGLLAHLPAWAYHKWYDENGVVHYTEADPPFDARNADGSSWWGEEVDAEEAADLARKQRIEQVRLKIKNRNAPQPAPKIEPVPDSDEEIPVETEEKALDEEVDQPIENKSLFQRIVAIFSKDEKDESVCEEPWLLEKHGICALEKPDMERIGNTFEAEVVNNRKGVWSDCRGTYNGDILIFTYKGNGYWETDGNVPECSFYQGFYWK